MRLFILPLIIWSNVVFGQITNQLKSDSSDIYVHAFNQYCQQVIKDLPEVNVIYVEQGKFYSHLLPNKIKNLEIKRVSKTDIVKMCKNGNHVYITEITPLLTKNDVFYVGIIPFKVHVKKKQFNYVNEGGINYNYLFHKETGQFEFINSKGGIPLY